MSYIEKKLVKDKNDIVKIYRITKWVVFNESLGLALSLALFIAGFFAPLNWPGSSWPLPFGLMSAVGLVFSLVLLVALCVELIKRISIEIAVTKTRLIGKKGILRIEVLDRQLGHIDFLKVKMSLIGRIFNFGQITIGSNNKEYVYKMVANPLDLQRTANSQLDQGKRINTDGSNN